MDKIGPRFSCLFFVKHGPFCMVDDQTSLTVILCCGIPFSRAYLTPAPWAWQYVTNGPATTTVSPTKVKNLDMVNSFGFVYVTIIPTHVDKNGPRLKPQKNRQMHITELK